MSSGTDAKSEKMTTSQTDKAKKMTQQQTKEFLRKTANECIKIYYLTKILPVKQPS